jgi:hypothetical protein
VRLFGIVDGSVDRYERAAWLTCPFDLALSTATNVHPIMVAGMVSTTGLAKGHASSSGLASGGTSTTGLTVGQVI